MQTDVVNMKADNTLNPTSKNTFSFSPFVTYLRNRVDVEKTVKAEFYRFVLNKFKLYPELETAKLNHAEAVKHTDLLELIYTILSPAIEDENKYYWALSTPVPSKIIYSTDAFANFLAEYQSKNEKAVPDSLSVFSDREVDFIYRLILEKLYKFPSDVGNDVIYTHENQNKLLKYYRIHTDTSFIEIKATRPLPELNAEVIEPCLYEGAGMDTLKEIIPLDMFELSGFSVITIDDITSEQALENIRLALVNHTPEQNDLYHDVLQSLKILSKHSSIDFGLLPFLKVNGKLIFDTGECSNSLLIRSANGDASFKEALANFIDQYMAKPSALFFSTMSERKVEQYPILKALKHSGIKSYAILPVYYNRRLAGIVEIYSEQKVIFYEKLLARLQTAVPLLSQLLQNSAEQFDLRMEEVIKSNFTMLQPAVEWKFNEAAWHYLTQQTEGIEKPDIETVSFHQVYPLYGAIDIRDSTIQHNSSLQKDMETLIALLEQTSDGISKHIPAHLARQLAAKSKKWLKKLSECQKANDETSLKTYLHNDITPYLFGFREVYPDTQGILNKYVEVTDEEKGKVYAYRRALERSVKMINKTLGDYFERAQPKLLNIYPCYFEKFRSDGIEYDIYTGQSIAPAINFTDEHLRAFRQWQVKSMIDVAKLTYTLIDKMPVPLQTASLIFVHSSQIDICFRNDERRFDVEGYYNIRYEVIKKRIDKVCIKNTTERLTQPGKISLVYFNDKEADDYLAFIKQYQKDGLLLNDLEFVQLEELQGVTGLRALRVSVKL